MSLEYSDREARSAVVTRQYLGAQINVNIPSGAAITWRIVSLARAPSLLGPDTLSL